MASLDQPSPDPATTEAGALRFVQHGLLGLPLACSSALVAPSIEAAIVRGHYEFDEAHAAVAVIGPGDRVLELGGGLGALAVHITRQRQPAAYDVVEASPGIAGLLRATLAANGTSGVRVHQRLLTDDRALLRAGQTSFFVPRSREFWAGSTLEMPAADIVTVPTASFCRLLLRRAPTVIICDIEGGELDLLAGPERPTLLRRLVWRRCLAKVHSIVVELHPAVIGAPGVAAIDRSLTKLGFAMAAELRGVATYRRDAKKAAASAAAA